MSSANELLAAVRMYGSLAPLAALTNDHDLAAWLRTAKVGKPSAIDVAVQARLTTLILREVGWSNSTIEAVVLSRHYGGKSGYANRISDIVRNEGRSKINKPAKALFAELRKNPEHLLAARASLGCQPERSVPAKDSG